MSNWLNSLLVGFSCRKITRMVLSRRSRRGSAFALPLVYFPRPIRARVGSGSLCSHKSGFNENHYFISNKLQTNCVIIVVIYGKILV